MIGLLTEEKFDMFSHMSQVWLTDNTSVAYNTPAHRGLCSRNTQHYQQAAPPGPHSKLTVSSR